MEELLKKVQEKYDSVCLSLEQCRRRLDDFNAQDEVKKANDRAEEVRRMSLYIMSKKEKDAAERFRKEHCGTCQKGRLSTTFEYVLTGTGIGTAISIRCPFCGAKEDITDIESW